MEAERERTRTAGVLGGTIWRGAGRRDGGTIWRPRSVGEGRGEGVAIDGELAGDATNRAYLSVQSADRLFRSPREHLGHAGGNDSGRAGALPPRGPGPGGVQFDPTRDGKLWVIGDTIVGVDAGAQPGPATVAGCVVRAGRLCRYQNGTGVDRRASPASGRISQSLSRSRPAPGLCKTVGRSSRTAGPIGAIEREPDRPPTR